MYPAPVAPYTHFNERKRNLEVNPKSRTRIQAKPFHGEMCDASNKKKKKN